MPQTSNLTSLSKLIQTKREEDRQKIEALTQRELQHLEESLQRQSVAALNTTGTAIQQIQKQIETVSTSAEALRLATDKQRQQLAATNQKQLKNLETQLQTEAKRLAWLLRLPTLALLIVYLLLCAATWAWWKLTAPYQVQTMPNGQQWQVMNGSGWRMCQNQPCRPLNP